MRLVITSVLLQIISSLAVSQINLTVTDAQAFYAPGKSWRYFENTKFNGTVNIGTASSSAQSWSFPTISYTDTVRIDNMLPSSTPYASKFLRATHARRAIQSSGGTTSTYYEFTRITTDSLIELGDVLRLEGGGVDTTVYSFQTHLSVLFPLTYGKSSSYRDSTVMGPGSWYIQRSTTTCDGFGTVSSPFGTFQAVRQKQTTISQTFFGGVSFSADTSVTFSWITKEGYFVDVDPKDKVPVGSSIVASTLSYSSIITTPTGVSREEAIPSSPQLSQNYPNPFNPTTTIEYVMPKSGFARLTVQNVLGQEVASLLNGFQGAGRHSVRFVADGLPSGVYFYRLTTSDHVSIGKMNLVK